MKIPALLVHLETDEFKELMVEQIGNLDFIKCTDDEIKSPLETRIIPSKPLHMATETYSEMNDKCFKCPIADRRSISNDTDVYLTSLELLLWPGEHEIDTQEVRSLLDHKKLT